MIHREDNIFSTRSMGSFTSIYVLYSFHELKYENVHGNGLTNGNQ